MRPARRNGLIAVLLGLAGALVIALQPDSGQRLRAWLEALSPLSAPGQSESAAPSATAHGEPGTQAAGAGVEEAPEEGAGAAEGDDDDDDDDDGPRGLTGYGRVQLDAETRARSGLRIVEAEAITRLEEGPALANVVDLAPLLALRAETHAIDAEAAAVGAAVEGTLREVERLRLLRSEGAGVPLRELQQAEARLRTERARAEGLAVRARDVRERAVQAFGPVLVEAALSGRSSLFERLLSREEVLLLVSLPPETGLDAETSVVYVDRRSDRNRARKAYRLAAATRSEAGLQGETWYFRTAAEGLRSGMRLDVWVPQGERPRTGVSIPVAALLWHEGRPWFYLEEGGEGVFERRPLPPDAQEFAKSLFLPSGLAPGDRVVATGAQTLLSEELRWAIPEEDDDD